MRARCEVGHAVDALPGGAGRCAAINGLLERAVNVNVHRAFIGIGLGEVADGDAVSYTFTGTSVSYLTKKDLS